MAQKFVAGRDAETFTSGHHTDVGLYTGGPLKFFFAHIGNSWEEGMLVGNGTPEELAQEAPVVISEIVDIISRYEGIACNFLFDVYDDNGVDYSASDAPVAINLGQTTQHGGFAEGDHLIDIGDVIGSSFNDVIRGQNSSAYPDHVPPYAVSGGVGGRLEFRADLTFVINNPGINVLQGAGGDDILEGRGGGDFQDVV